MGLSSEEFYTLQLRQLHALIERWQRSEENREYMPAQIVASNINYSMGRPKESVSARDFMPSMLKRLAKHEPVRRNKQIVATEIRGVMAGMMKAPNGRK